MLFTRSLSGASLRKHYTVFIITIYTLVVRREYGTRQSVNGEEVVWMDAVKFRGRVVVRLFN